MPYYMKYDGIDGDVTEQDHVKWIELSSFQFGNSRNLRGTAAGAARGREAGLCTVSEVVVTKPTDSASQNLMRESMIGSIPGKTVKVEMVTTGQAGQAEVYAKFDMEECIITNYALSGAGDRPMESLALNFTKITYSMAQGGTGGTLDMPQTGYFDLRTAKGG
jgi:type VI secretion system secreted protein Hcp